MNRRAVGRMKRRTGRTGRTGGARGSGGGETPGKGEAERFQTAVGRMARTMWGEPLAAHHEGRRWRRRRHDGRWAKADRRDRLPAHWQAAGRRKDSEVMGTYGTATGVVVGIHPTTDEWMCFMFADGEIVGRYTEAGYMPAGPLTMEAWKESLAALLLGRFAGNRKGGDGDEVA